ncbi:MAG: glycosyltransferase family 2 protein [Muribaculaceae bacterium]|nr:glycosyltransferase family 2 protein [Muribaculaceae bacterium]
MIYHPLSIVVPVRNRPDLIIRCLDSVYNQTYRPIRLFVVDNASTDSTPERVREWMESHHSDDFQTTLLFEVRPGAAAARNRGLREVDTEVMLFFDSDDTMRPELAITVMEAFDREKKLDMVVWRVGCVNEKEEVIPAHFAHRDILGNHLYHAVLSTQAYAVRTSFFKLAGGWNPELRVWDDWELGLRLLAKSPRIKSVFRVLSHVYPQVDSITGTEFHSRKGQWEGVIDLMERETELYPEAEGRRIKDILTYRRVILAAHYAREGFSQSGLELLEKALADSNLPKWRKQLLRMLYRYTAKGGRGAYLLWK